LHDPAASSYHAEVHYDKTNNIVEIRDKESTNGTFLNSKRILETKTLQHEDQVRIGVCLISINQIESQSVDEINGLDSRTRVTSELILESVDHYGVLLHEISLRLINLPDLDVALAEIAQLVKRIIAAEECQIIMADQFNKLNEKGIPTSLAQKVIKNKSAAIFSNPHQDTSRKTVPAQLMSPILLVPVMIDGNVVAIIFSRKPSEPLSRFYNSDLQVVLAISNQVAMSIQRNRVEQKLIHNSNHDALTNLPNREFFLGRLSRSLARSKEEKEFEFAVLFFDFDDFKIINDSLGHAIGDQLLIAIAERLKHNVRVDDTVSRSSIIARFGGDEFAILLDDVKEKLFALATATRLKDMLSGPFHITGKQIFVTASIGVAMSTTGYESPEDILQDADIAMYKAKELGKSRVAIYDRSMRARALKRMRIGTALRRGALEQEFRLHYQPIISVQTGQIAGYEALLRWHTPNQGILTPAQFMDAIDTVGLIYTTDHWALKNACKQTAKWQNEFPSTLPFFVSVNLSAKNINHPNLIDNINQILHETKLKPESLWLEITEKVVAPGDESAVKVLKKLRSMGVQICLDDFGTGYSALNYLAQFPVDVLKIDQSLIKMIGVKETSEKIIEMVKTLANYLGIIVVAEGVETEEQVSFIRSINCEYIQGYFYSKPLASQVIAELMSKG
jgi:diguanylate cyclase (GGDEF)-like protein